MTDPNLLPGSTKAEWLEGFRKALCDPLDELLTVEKRCLLRYAATKDHDYIDVAEELSQAVSNIIGAISTINTCAKRDEP